MRMAERVEARCWLEAFEAWLLERNPQPFINKAASETITSPERNVDPYRAWKKMLVCFMILITAAAPVSFWISGSRILSVKSSVVLAKLGYDA